MPTKELTTFNTGVSFSQMQLKPEVTTRNIIAALRTNVMGVDHGDEAGVTNLRRNPARQTGRLPLH
jgi:hypothetical protein